MKFSGAQFCKPSALFFNAATAAHASSFCRITRVGNLLETMKEGIKTAEAYLKENRITVA